MTTQTPKITVLIADDYEVTRQGIRHILEQVPEIEIVGEAEDGEQLFDLVARLHPQIILLDLVMPNHSPVEFEKWVRTHHPEVITLVLTGHDRDVYLSGMMEAGAAGYLDKKLRAGELIQAIRRAVAGETVYSREQILRARRWREETSQKWESLSGREKQVLQLLTEGKGNQTIAEVLGLKINTVEKHLDHIYKKLGVSSRTEAAHWWVENNTQFP